MDMHQIVDIFLSSLEKYQVMKLVSTMGLSRQKSMLIQFIPVKSSITDPQAVNVTAIATSPSIEQKLSEHGLQLIRVIGDGNCFFRAVSLNILRESEAWACNLKLRGIDIKGMSVDTISKALRQLFVNELLGERRSQYKAFVEMGDVDYRIIWFAHAPIEKTTRNVRLNPICAKISAQTWPHPQMSRDDLTARDSPHDR